MSLEKPPHERVPRALWRWMYPVAVALWLLSPHGAESADIPRKASFPSGIILLQTGAKEDGVETAAMFMERQNGIGQWTSEEHGEFETDRTFTEIKDQIEDWIKAVGVQRGETVTIWLWHTHTTHLMRLNYPTLEHPENAVSPPSLGFMGKVGDTGRIDDEALKIQVLKPLEAKYGITINHIPGVVNPTCRWKITQMPVDEWRAKYPDLPEIYIMGTMWVPWTQDVERYLKDSDFMEKRVEDIARQQGGVEEEQVLRDWIVMLGETVAEARGDTLEHATAGVRGYVNLGENWNDKIRHFTQAMLSAGIPEDLGQAIFGGTSLDEFPGIQRQVHNANVQGTEFAMQDRYDALIAALAEESAQKPFDDWANGGNMRALIALLEETGVRLTVEPAL